MPSFAYSVLETLGSLVIAVASVILVLLLWNTVKPMEHDSKTNTFVHKDMWVDTTDSFHEN